MKRHCDRIFLLMGIVVFVSGCGFFVPISEDKSTNSKIDNSSEEIDVSQWQAFNAEEEGVDSELFPNVQFPSDWFTYNYAGGTVVKVFFSDGGIFANQSKSQMEMVEILWRNSDRSYSNECIIAVQYNGATSNYFIPEKMNNKQLEADKEQCARVLQEIENKIVL